jgi:hypothetical protein
MNATATQVEIFSGTITITRRKDGEYRTFKIWAKPAKKEDTEVVRFLGVLNGPDNQRDYRPFALVKGRGIYVFKKLRTTGEARVLKSWADMVRDFMLNGGAKYKGFDFELSKACARCGKALTTPESLELGLGPICAQRGV